jgi:hypothetical protein
MYYFIDGSYKRAPIFECQIVTSWSRLPFVSLLVVSDHRTAIRLRARLDPLVTDFVFNHSSCDRLRIGFHRCVPHAISTVRILALSSYVRPTGQFWVRWNSRYQLHANATDLAAMTRGVNADALTMACELLCEGHVDRRGSEGAAALA